MGFSIFKRSYFQSLKTLFPLFLTDKDAIGWVLRVQLLTAVGQ